jgi:hypothetical protein
VRRLILAAVAGLIVAILVAAQIFLPAIATDRLRTQLQRSGQVLSVSVSAFPAIELLWHHADSVTIRLGRYRSPSAKIGSSLSQASDVGTLHASAVEVDAGLLRLHDASLVKRGDRLTGSAAVSEADLQSAIPLLQSVTPVASGGGQLVLRGTASAFGLAVSVDATVRALAGKLVVTPDVPLGGFATLTLFSHPGVHVDSVSATPVTGGFAVRGLATVH